MTKRIFVDNSYSASEYTYLVCILLQKFFKCIIIIYKYNNNNGSTYID